MIIKGCKMSSFYVSYHISEKLSYIKTVHFLGSFDTYVYLKTWLKLHTYAHTYACSLDYFAR